MVTMVVPAFRKLSHTPAYGRVKDEASSIGDAFVKELGKTATWVVLPAFDDFDQNFIGGYLPTSSTIDSTRSASMKDESMRQSSGFELSANIGSRTQLIGKHFES